MDGAPIHSIRELGRLYREQTLSPVEVVRETLARIERIDPALNSFLTVTADQALAQAARAEEEIRSSGMRSPLHGVPYAAKDLLDTKGVRTTVGSCLMAENIPQSNAAVVQRLADAGAILIGKTGLHEWAYGITSTNPHFGAIRNPWDPRRIPGGSSGGSTSAQAAGLCVFSLGSDTGGSIRLPAALCGVAGLKPTFGRISRRGAFPLGHTLDTLGPFGTTVEDLGVVYSALAGWDPDDRASVRRPVESPSFEVSPNLSGRVLGIPDTFYYKDLDPEIDRAMQDALRVMEGLGADLRPVPVPDIAAANALHRLILLAEAASVHRRRLDAHRESFGDDVRKLLDQGRFVLATDYLDAQRARRQLCDSFDDVLTSVDALVIPGVPVPTARVEQMEIVCNGKLENVRLATTRNIRALNLIGLPVVSVPCGFRTDGMPIGMQIVGGRFEEARILAIGHAYELATDWHRRTPPVALAEAH